MNALDIEDLKKGLIELNLIHYHEAGHAVAFHMLRFPPTQIKEALAKHDRRSSAFFRTRKGMLNTPLAIERAQDYAVACIAGIAAESKFSGVSLADLRQTAGKDDYEAVHAIVERVMLRRGLEVTEEVRDAYLHLWEQRAITLMKQPIIWSAVESVANELLMLEGVMGRAELDASIRQGLKIPDDGGCLGV